MDLSHGGNVQVAADKYGIAANRWIDLSTGISPWSWPVPAIPEYVWQTLPQSKDGLEEVAAAYYGCQVESLLAVPGSQYALQKIPHLFSSARVALPLCGYAEHELAWRNAGHTIVHYSDAASLEECITSAQVEHAVVINPENPTAQLWHPELLLRLHAALSRREGSLIVDEAFADASQGYSLCDQSPLPGLVIFRSLGKFFGLAGVRLGFMIASQDILLVLKETMPPWAVSHPARWIGLGALDDKRWQEKQVQRLADASSRWLKALSLMLPAMEWSVTTLFATGSGSEAHCKMVHRYMAEHGVLLRSFEARSGRSLLRMGWPALEKEGKVKLLMSEVSGDGFCTDT